MIHTETITSKVINPPNAKQSGIPPYYYRKRNNIVKFSPYQTLQQIQNTVRVDADLYTANVGPLTAYRPAVKEYYGVCWNQMSDRPIPSVGRASVPTGSNNSSNTRRHSVTSSRPGCQTPGGIGCDIKHNSYDRRLNRLKGPLLKRGTIKSENNVAVIDKRIKTNIVSGCVCNEANVYKGEISDYPTASTQYAVGTSVLALRYPSRFIYGIATIIGIESDEYLVEFVCDKSTRLTNNVFPIKKVCV